LVVEMNAGMHENVVRYHTAWFESDYLYIQMELCDSTLGQYAASIPATSLECSLLTALWQVGFLFLHFESHY
jgi:wee1-like protein kinase